MGVEESPAFQWYVKEWRSSRVVMRMTYAQRGMYLEMLNEQWENLTLPDDAAACAELLGGTVAEWTRNWPVLRRKFVTEAGGRIFNARLEKERKKQRDSSKGGKRRSSDAPRATDGTFQPAGSPAGHPAETPAGSPAVAPGVEPATSSVAIALPIALPIAFALPQKSDGGSKRPIYSSDRFAVFEWQLDELAKTLGSHLDAFDLHDFFDHLSRQSRDSGLVIPSDRDARWKWLQAEVEAEAQRRGLPMATVASEPTNKRIAGLVAGGQAFLNRGQK